MYLSQTNIFHFQSLNGVLYFLGETYFLGFAILYGKMTLFGATYLGYKLSNLFSRPYRDYHLNDFLVLHDPVSCKMHGHCIATY